MRRAILLRLGQFLARIGEAVQAAALRGAGVVAARKPPRRATHAAEQITVPGPVENPTAIAPRAWRLPSPEEVDRARGECAAYGVPQLKICRGPAKGCGDGVDQTKCRDCYHVAWHDTRPSAEILASIERGDA